MRSAKIITLALTLCLLHSFLAVSSKGIPGYIFSADKVPSNNLLKETLSSGTFNDQDVKTLVLHNLGLLNFDSQVPKSAQDLISTYGSRSLIRQGKLNYVFLLEGGASQAIFDAEKKAFNKQNLKHQAALFDVCNGADTKECLVNQLFSEDEGSVVNLLKKQTGNQKPEAYFFSSNLQTAASFPKHALTTTTDRKFVNSNSPKGNVFVMEHSTKTPFKISNNLDSCVNSLLKGEYVVDLGKRTITPEKRYQKDVEAPVLSFGEDTKDEFLSFMNDICSVGGVSTLIRKDPNPSFFVFHINSLNKLGKLLSEEENVNLYRVFNVAYEKFTKNLETHYKSDEISGQVFILSPENALEVAAAQNLMLLEINGETFQPRILAEQAATQGISSTTSIIFKSVLIGFVLVIAWVCLEMFNMDIQQDSVVYAKFLAADYFRR